MHKIKFVKVGLLLAILLLSGLALPNFAPSVYAETSFAGQAAFRAKWIEQDQLVGAPGINRPYTWGPNVAAAAGVVTEPYQNSPNGQRAVLYLDKARMEINNPATNFVTTGLAVKELVSGQRQDGDDSFTALAPSQTQVAGDPVEVNPNTPVYASFQNLVTLGNADSNSKPAALNSTITDGLGKNGAVVVINPPENITISAYEAKTGHNIARPFRDFQYQRGPTTNPSNGNTQPNQLIYTDNPTANVFGYAISEPYWVTTKIAGQERTVLVQLFERRVLTYNPALASNRVEMGNLGQHYFRWRYVESGNPPPAPPVNPPPTTCSSNTGPNLNAEEQAFLGLINSYRQANGKGTLAPNQNLTNAAKWMSQDMADRNYFSHTDSQGRDPFQRIRDFGYNYRTAGENLAAGYETAAQAIEGWKNSPGHNANMLNGNYLEIGIARACNASSQYRWYWTTTFGAR